MHSILETQIDSGFADAARSRDVVRSAEGCNEEFNRHAHVQNPEEVSDHGEQQNEQPLRRRNLKSMLHRTTTPLGA